MSTQMSKCILAPYKRSKKGYGAVYNPEVKHTVSAHRYAYEKKHGKIPAGFYVCHKCDNPMCMNVDHLFLGTHSDNMRDSVSKLRHKEARKRCCPQGHPYEGDNLIIKSNGNRRCRTCHNISAAKYRSKR